MSERIPVAVLAATGSVGQRFIQLLDGHPWFEVTAVTGSERRIGELYGDSCRWLLPEAMPDSVRNMKIIPSTPEAVNVPLVFSALPSKYAGKIEASFAKAGVAVCSNAGKYRNEDDVPILLPEVNANHLDLIHTQRRNREWEGLIVTNPNCTSTGMTVTLKALGDAFGIQKVFMVSMQAISGAGYPGVASLDIVGNVIPFIKGEEEKVEWEPRKILGQVKNGVLDLAEFQISVHTNRVAVIDGHMVCMSVAFNSQPDLDTAVEALEGYRPPQISCDLPSTPKPTIFYHRDPDRPQPRLDRMIGNGMTTIVGRLRQDPLFDLKMVVLSHNTIRGAAGGSIYNAELLAKLGYLKG